MEIYLPNYCDTVNSNTFEKVEKVFRFGGG